MTAISLSDLAGRPQWVAWRNEIRNGKSTKVPYCAPDRRAEANDPSTWLTHDRAAALTEHLVNGAGGGIGIELGACGDLWLVGVDLDTCRDPQTGAMSPWAAAVLQRLNTYAEVSPSGTGVKAFALIDPQEIASLRTIMRTEHGRQFKQANGGDHPPAIELHISNRYFAVTWQGLDDAPTELRVVPPHDMRWLLEEAGPAFTGKTQHIDADSAAHVHAAEDVLARLDRAAQHDKRLAAALTHAATMHGGSRSEGALAVGAALVRLGWSCAEMTAALLGCPATKDWAKDAQSAQGDRQFARIWEKAQQDTATAENAHGGQQRDTEAELECVPLQPIDVTDIPPRPWAYGRFLLFGSAAVLGAVDGGGKGAIAVVLALSMITGKPLLGEHVWRTGPVAIITYEDDETEWQRRIAAACRQYGLDYRKVVIEFHFIRQPGGRVFLARHSDGSLIFPHSDQIIEHLKRIRAVLLIVDPFNHAHDLEDGNSNTMVARVAAELSRIAADSKAATLVLHHLRKGSVGNPDDLMGATSLRATFRSCRILARMDPETAKKMNVGDAWRYVRISGSKENYAPPPERATWFRLVGIELGNASDEYPEGDSVAVATTWQPRAMFEGMDTEALRRVFDALRQTVHGPNKQAKHTPWAGKALMELGGRSEREATRIVSGWIESGVLVKGTYYHTDSRHEVACVSIDQSRVAAILAELEVVSAPSD